MRKLLTIAIPTYNRGRLVAGLVEVLLAKIRPFRSEVGLVVSNNCSTDDTEKRLLALQGDSGFQYFKNAKNIGAERNMLRCFELSDSAFTWVVGDDDDMSGVNLEEIVDSLRSASDQTNVFHFDCALVDGRNDKVIKGSFYDVALPRTFTIAEFADLVAGKGTSVCMWLGGNIVRTKTLNDARKIWEDIKLPGITLYWYSYCILNSKEVRVFDKSHVKMVCNTTGWQKEFGARLPVFDILLVHKKLAEQPGLLHVDKMFSREISIVLKQPLFSRLWFKVLLARRGAGFGDLKKALQNKIITKKQVCLIFILGPIALLAKKILREKRQNCP